MRSDAPAGVQGHDSSAAQLVCLEKYFLLWGSRHRCPAARTGQNQSCSAAEQQQADTRSLAALAQQAGLLLL